MTWGNRHARTLGDVPLYERDFSLNVNPFGPPRRSAVAARRALIHVSIVAAAAAAGALEDPGFLDRSRRAFHREGVFVRRALQGVAGLRIQGSASNMLLLEIDGVRSTTLTAALAARGIAVVDGRSFKGLEDRDAIRVSLRDRAANAELVAALTELISTIPVGPGAG